LVEFAALIFTGFVFTGSVWPEPGQLVINETVEANMCGAQWKSSLFCVAPSKSAEPVAMMAHFDDTSITPPAMKN
jgi:hypothetical protein